MQWYIKTIGTGADTSAVIHLKCVVDFHTLAWIFQFNSTQFIPYPNMIYTCI